MTIHLTPLPHDPPADGRAFAPESLSQAGTPQRAAHLLIIASIVLASSALALALIQNAGFDPGLAATASLGLCTWAGLMHWILTREPRAKPVALTPAKKRRGPRREPTLKMETPPAEPRVEPSDLALELIARGERAGETPTAQPARPEPVAAPTMELASQVSALEAWSRDETVPAPQPAPATAPAWPDLSQTRRAPASAAPTETEFERVERLVKRLADNVNQFEALQAAKTAEPEFAAGAAADPDNALAASISALKRANHVPQPHEMAADVVSEGALPAGVAPVSQPEVTSWPKPDAPRFANPETGSQRSAILSALNEQRIDVFLQPILDLGNQKPQHYEVSIALRTANGTAIDLAQAASDLSGTGLLPLIDQVRIARASQMARRLAERGKAGAVFAEMNGETLNDGGFQDTFANRERPVGAFPGQLVLTLPQDHVMTFTTADWQTLARLHAAGFGFALCDVTTLDMDFAGLTGAGFVFARLDAEAFLIGLPTANGVVPPADICRHLASCGLTLIVGGIVEEHQLARIFGFGVLFGQGQLFGAARAVKPDMAQAQAVAAA
jgi:cyclic-di-GMP phosphodiesterase, flagellum assembly factor TipF